MAEPKPIIYVLQSAVRGRSNRTARAAVPGRQSFVQKLAGGRIVVRRARPARISEAVLFANLDEIKAAVARHNLVVTTQDGRPVDLDSFTVGTLAAASPLPNPPLDSAKNDKNDNIGYKVPGTPEGTPIDAPVPELLQPSVLLSPESDEGEPTEDSEEEELDVEPETEPLPATETSPSSQPPPSRRSGKGKRGRS